MTRLERYDIFKKFFANSGDIFNEINNKYKPHADLRRSHGFYVAPGSRNGGQDTTVVDVFFGHRPYNSSKKIINMQITTEIDIAYGTSLHYWQLDNGYIFVTLYPAYTEKHKTQEEFIIFDEIKDPRKLLKRNYIMKHYKYLVSYLAVTCIEDRPRIIDRIKIFYLRSVKKYYINKITYEAKIKKQLVNILKLILTIGFSGFLLAFLPLFINLNKNKEVEKQINTLIEKQEEVINVLKMLNKKINDFDYIIQIEELKVKLDELNESIKKIDVNKNEDKH